jgi:hypothetical protein
VAAVSLDQWLLAFHVLGAFAVVGAIAFFAVTVIAGFGVDRPSSTLELTRIARVPNVMVMVGMTMTLVFGIWLAISLDAYQPWDGWIIAAYVLWAVAGGTGARGGDAYQRAARRARELVAAGDDDPNAELASLLRDRTSLLLNGISTVATLLLLLDMIWKPGA